MMRKVFGILMTTLFLLLIFQQAWVVVYFKLNQVAIEKTFCINRDKPELQCQGKCHLKKELQETDHTDFSLIKRHQTSELILWSPIEFKVCVFEHSRQKAILIYRMALRATPSLRIPVPPPRLLMFFKNELLDQLKQIYLN